MSIPEPWRGVLETGSERTPFWTTRTADLRGRFAGRAARISREHLSGRADFLHLSVTCQVRGLFRMIPPGGLAPAMPLKSTFDDVSTGDAELDQRASFWSDDPKKIALLLLHNGVKPALIEVMGLTERGFGYLTIQNGEMSLVHDLSRATLDASALRRGFSALAVLAAAAEKTWPPDNRDQRWGRFRDEGWPYIILVVAIFLLAIAFRMLAG